MHGPMNVTHASDCMERVDSTVKTDETVCVPSIV